MAILQKGLFPEAKEQAKGILFEEIATNRLMIGCKELDERFLLGLFGGYWPFVSGFPQVIEKSYADLGRFAQGEREQRLFSKIGRLLAGSKELSAVARDEAEHKGLWLLSAKQASYLKGDLENYQVPPSAFRLTKDIEERIDFIDVLLDFASVEFVAEGISRTLMDSPEFRGLMGEKGKRWFEEHFVATHDGTPHEDISLAFARDMAPIIRGQDLTSEEVAKKCIASGRRFIVCANDIVANLH